MNDDEKAVSTGSDAPAKNLQRGYETDVAEGYFAVCREYVPGGVNGKPPERTTPAGEVVIGESPSVYQSMYRSLFDRKQLSTLEGSKGSGKTTKRARNVFYVVLRHGHLMLYDDSEQVEVRHVISLAHHTVSIYGGGDEIPEGELWIKRNAICLGRKKSFGDIATDSKPFYFFSENCSEKEDFYFALLRNQDRAVDDPYSPPRVQHFEVKDIITLVQRLHSSEEQLQTRWINALMGRLFLAMYKTQEIEHFVRVKVTKKISRVKKPVFLSGIVLQKIDLGEAAPYFTNPRLKDLTVNGDCCVEADIRYDGNFKLEVSATARIDLGARFKVREVNLVLAVVIKKVDGHCLVKLKPPPSNRLWVAFEAMPHVEMSIEPVVSSRQITYGIILRAIESRIREVVAETLVLPNWDDIPITSTLHQRYRGGIWAEDRQESCQSTRPTSLLTVEPEEEAETDGPHGVESAVLENFKDDRSQSLPALLETLAPHAQARKGHKTTISLAENSETAISTGLQKRSEPPKAIRSRSFASAADPVLSMDNANVDASKKAENMRQTKDAASTMIEISSRSQPTSPAETQMSSLNSQCGSISEVENEGNISSSSSHASSTKESNNFQATITNPSSPSVPHSPASICSRSTTSNSKSGSHRSMKADVNARIPLTSKSTKTFTGIGAAAAAAAKSWGWNTLSRTKIKNEDRLQGTDRAGTPEHPIGRGHPLPPPGQPLPRPQKHSSTPISIPKRKPLPPPLLPDRRRYEAETLSDSAPILPQRQEAAMSTGPQNGNGNLLVVEAPLDSEPTSPLDEGYGEFVDNVRLDDEEGIISLTPIHSSNQDLLNPSSPHDGHLHTSHEV